MDEYFCTRCGAILNDQCGFDPYGGTWTCNECGQLLMDDDVYDGDTYPGVAWYCDECDSLWGNWFSDIYDLDMYRMRSCERNNRKWHLWVAKIMSTGKESWKVWFH